MIEPDLGLIRYFHNSSWYFIGPLPLSMVQMSNFYLRSVRKILLENDPAPIQGTAKAILLRPRPPSTTRGPWPPLLDHRDPRKAIRTKTVGGLQNCIPSRALGPFCQQLVLAKGTQNRFQRAQVLKRIRTGAEYWDAEGRMIPALMSTRIWTFMPPLQGFRPGGGLPSPLGPFWVFLRDPIGQLCLWGLWGLAPGEQFIDTAPPS
jgi:hypothetical protein